MLFRVSVRGWSETDVRVIGSCGEFTWSSMYVGVGQLVVCQQPMLRGHVPGLARQLLCLLFRKLGSNPIASGYAVLAPHHWHVGFPAGLIGNEQMACGIDRPILNRSNRVPFFHSGTGLVQKEAARGRRWGCSGGLLQGESATVCPGGFSCEGRTRCRLNRGKCHCTRSGATTARGAASATSAAQGLP